MLELKKYVWTLRDHKPYRGSGSGGSSRAVAVALAVAVIIVVLTVGGSNYESASVKTN